MVYFQCIKNETDSSLIYNRVFEYNNSENPFVDTVYEEMLISWNELESEQKYLLQKDILTPPELVHKFKMFIETILEWCRLQAKTREEQKKTINKSILRKKKLIITTSAALIAAIAGFSKMVDIKKVQLAEPPNLSVLNEIDPSTGLSELTEIQKQLNNLAEDSDFISERLKRIGDRDLTPNEESKLMHQYDKLIYDFRIINSERNNLRDPTNSDLKMKLEEILEKSKGVIYNLHDFLFSKGLKIQPPSLY